MRSDQLKKLDILLLIMFPVLAAGTSLLFRISFFASTLLFFGLPAAWFSYRTQHAIKKTALFSLIFAVAGVITLDYIGTASKAWYEPQSIFSYRFFGILPIEDLIWSFLLVYTIIMMYEHFLHKGRHELIDRRMKYFVWPVALFAAAAIVAYIINPLVLQSSYTYTVLGIIFLLLPSITFLSRFPRLISKYVKVGSYFFVYYLVYEMTGLQLGWWMFPGKYLGWINIFGFRIPFEEFFFWLVLTAISILSYYEFFDENPTKDNAKT